MYDVIIQRNVTGELRRRHFDNLNWDDEGSLFWWTEGNFSCDCNRRAEFKRADPDHIEPEDTRILFGACGDFAYSALKAILPDGREISLDEM